MPVRAVDEWRGVPALQRTFSDDPRLNPPSAFAAGLRSWQSPLFLGPLGHEVRPDAPSGLVHGLVSSVATGDRTDLTLRRPVLQRLRVVPGVRPETVDAEAVTSAGDEAWEPDPVVETPGPADAQLEPAVVEAQPGSPVTETPLPAQRPIARSVPVLHRAPVVADTPLAAAHPLVSAPPVARGLPRLALTPAARTTVQRAVVDAPPGAPAAPSAAVPALAPDVPTVPPAPAPESAPEPALPPLVDDAGAAEPVSPLLSQQAPREDLSPSPLVRTAPVSPSPPLPLGPLALQRVEAPTPDAVGGQAGVPGAPTVGQRLQAPPAEAPTAVRPGDAVRTTRPDGQVPLLGLGEPLGTSGALRLDLQRSGRMATPEVASRPDPAVPDVAQRSAGTVTPDVLSHVATASTEVVQRGTEPVTPDVVQRTTDAHLPGPSSSPPPVSRASGGLGPSARRPGLGQPLSQVPLSLQRRSTSQVPGDPDEWPPAPSPWSTPPTAVPTTPPEAPAAASAGTAGQPPPGDPHAAPVVARLVGEEPLGGAPQAEVERGPSAVPSDSGTGGPLTLARQDVRPGAEVRPGAGVADAAPLPAELVAPRSTPPIHVVPSAAPASETRPVAAPPLVQRTTDQAPELGSPRPVTAELLGQPLLPHDSGAPTSSSRPASAVPTSPMPPLALQRQQPAAVTVHSDPGDSPPVAPVDRAAQPPADDLAPGVPVVPGAEERLAEAAHAVAPLLGSVPDPSAGATLPDDAPAGADVRPVLEPLLPLALQRQQPAAATPTPDLADSGHVVALDGAAQPSIPSYATPATSTVPGAALPSTETAHRVAPLLGSVVGGSVGSASTHDAPTGAEVRLVQRASRPGPTPTGPARPARTTDRQVLDLPTSVRPEHDGSALALLRSSSPAMIGSPDAPLTSAAATPYAMTSGVDRATEVRTAEPPVPAAGSSLTDGLLGSRPLVVSRAGAVGTGPTAASAAPPLALQRDLLAPAVPAVPASTATLPTGGGTTLPTVQRAAPVDAGSAAVAAGVAVREPDGSVRFLPPADAAPPPVQRAAEAAYEPGPRAAETATVSAARTATTATDGAEPAAELTAAQVELLVRRLYEPLSARLRRELRLDRERHGTTLDLHR